VRLEDGHECWVCNDPKDYTSLSSGQTGHNHESRYPGRVSKRVTTEFKYGVSRLDLSQDSRSALQNPYMKPIEYEEGLKTTKKR
jgi:hypothetical protein